jgi:cyclase
MRLRLLLGCCLVAAATAVPAQQEDYSKVQIKTTQLTPGLLLLQGSGGNMTASIGPDGVLLVDDEFGPLAEKIRAALRKAGADKPVRFVVDTHYHMDHTDGNAAFAEGGAVLISHDNLRSRLASGGTIGNGGSISLQVKPAMPSALPLITYQRELTVHLNGTTVRVRHYAHAHTDGDSVVFFPAENIVAMGDIYVRYGFPFIDTNGGGNVRGMIGACEDVLRNVGPGARIIPGHGEVASIDDLREYLKMLVDSTALVEKALKGHQSLAQMKQEKLLGAWSDRYSRGGFVNTEAFTESLYNSLNPPVRPATTP